jgi:integrating conjugative element relaxase (TIGR03760 family)
MTVAAMLPHWFWPLAIYGGAFALGVAGCARLIRSRRVVAPRPAAQTTPRRPSAQIAVQDFDQLVAATGTADLVVSIEQRMRLSQENFRADVLPVLRAFAEFVQLLPASESHHHAQPGGLLIHALECADIALAFRAAAELPPGRPTELRKKLEHRWTYAVLLAALLHDLGKPVTDVLVTAYGEDPRAGRPWAPLAGTLREAGALYYRVDFAETARRDYSLHQKLPAVLMQRFVPQRLMQWLSEDPVLLEELFGYLAGESRTGPIVDLARRADAESVRRNLRSGPRTRFASARVVPLIERLMQALRRMLLQGGSLTLNRKGATGWVYDGAVWFVCARIADDVRDYLAANESAEAIPPKDKNDRLFDTWQEYGAIETNPETGGAVWTVVVECDGWTSPPLTVLRFPLERLFESPADYPAPLNGRVIVQPKGAAVPLSPDPEARAAPVPPAQAGAAKLQAATGVPVLPPARSPTRRQRGDLSPTVGSTGQQPPAPSPALEDETQAAMHSVVTVAPTATAAAPSAPATVVETIAVAADDGLLASAEAARTESARSPASPAGHALPAPRHAFDAASTDKLRKAPELAIRFMNWVAAAVGSGEIRHNESGSLVHFCERGALLLTPEIFRRFVQTNAAAADGALAAAIAEGEDKAISRVQSALRKAGWTVRNGDQNIHYYTFPKADGSSSRRSAFVLIGVPQLFWNPVPAPNPRLQRLPDPPKRLQLTAAGGRESRPRVA